MKLHFIFFGKEIMFYIKVASKLFCLFWKIHVLRLLKTILFNSKFDMLIKIYSKFFSNIFQIILQYKYKKYYILKICEVKIESNLQTIFIILIINIGWISLASLRFSVITLGTPLFSYIALTFLISLRRPNSEFQVTKFRAKPIF